MSRKAKYLSIGLDSVVYSHWVLLFLFSNIRIFSACGDVCPRRQQFHSDTRWWGLVCISGVVGGNDMIFEYFFTI